MKKFLIQSCILIASFFLLWFGLNQLNWIEIFKVEQTSKSTEEKLGDLFWEMFNASEKEILTKKVTAPLDSILTRICKANHIDRAEIKLHILQNNDINAFALPNKHLVVFSGLILASESEAELAGVISHEVAHIRNNHVMKKLMKEVGLSVLISMTTGNGGSEAIKQVAKLLSSSSYDRNLEKEADIAAVDYMLNAKINPEPFADFLFRLGNGENESMKYFSWVSTHPDSKERAEYIIEYSGGKKEEINPILSEQTWQSLQEYLTED